jgi:hypothetical protein
MMALQQEHMQKAREVVEKLLSRFGVNDAHVNSLGLSEHEVASAISEAYRSGVEAERERAAKIAEAKAGEMATLMAGAKKIDSEAIFAGQMVISRAIATAIRKA